jgi:hypothetical protein
VLHSILAIVALLVNTVLSIYKPRGLTAYGHAKQQSHRKAEARVPSTSDVYVGPAVGKDGASATRTPKWIYIVAIHAIGLILVFFVLHLAGAPMPGH